MKKFIIPAVAALFLIFVLGGFAYWRTTQKQTQDDSSQGEQKTAQKEESGWQNFKLSDLINTDGSFHCTFSYRAENEDASNGDIYMTQRGQKMRGTFLSKMGERPDVEGNILRDGQYQYFWQTGETQGMKFLIDETDTDIFANDATQLEDTPAATSETTETPDDVDYSCEPWRADDSKFVVPGGITFVDFQAQMDQLKSTMPADVDTSEDQAIPGSQCAVCDQVPEGDAREQCLTALGC
jgi:hypothetical protein